MRQPHLKEVLTPNLLTKFRQLRIGPPAENRRNGAMRRPCTTHSVQSVLIDVNAAPKLTPRRRGDTGSVFRRRRQSKPASATCFGAPNERPAAKPHPPTAAEHLANLAWLRRVRDRIPRVQVRLRRVALQLPDDQSVAEVPRCWLLVAWHLQHPLYRTGRHVPGRLPASGSARLSGGPAVHSKTGVKTGQESRSTRRSAAPTITTMDLSIHTTPLPNTDPEASLAFYRDVLGFEVRKDVGSGDMR